MPMTAPPGRLTVATEAVGPGACRQEQLFPVGERGNSAQVLHCTARGLLVQGWCAPATISTHADFWSLSVFLVSLCLSGLSLSFWSLSFSFFLSLSLSFSLSLSLSFPLFASKAGRDGGGGGEQPSSPDSAGLGLGALRDWRGKVRPPLLTPTPPHTHTQYAPQTSNCRGSSFFQRRKNQCQCPCRCFCRCFLITHTQWRRCWSLVALSTAVLASTGHCCQPSLDGVPACPACPSGH